MPLAYGSGVYAVVHALVCDMHVCFVRGSTRNEICDECPEEIRACAFVCAPPEMSKVPAFAVGGHGLGTENRPRCALRLLSVCFVSLSSLWRLRQAGADPVLT